MQNDFILFTLPMTPCFMLWMWLQPRKIKAREIIVISLAAMKTVPQAEVRERHQRLYLCYSTKGTAPAEPRKLRRQCRRPSRSTAQPCKIELSIKCSTSSSSSPLTARCLTVSVLVLLVVNICNNTIPHITSLVNIQGSKLTLGSKL